MFLAFFLCTNGLLSSDIFVHFVYLVLQCGVAVRLSGTSLGAVMALMGGFDDGVFPVVGWLEKESS